MLARCWDPLCPRMRRQLRSAELSVSWKRTWVWQGNVSDSQSEWFSKGRGLTANDVCSSAVMRLGNSVEALEAAKRAIHLSDSVLRLCLTISHLNRAMYFACDNVLWAGKTGLISKLDQHKWSQRSFRYVRFCFGLIFAYVLVTNA